MFGRHGASARTRHNLRARIQSSSCHAVVRFSLANIMISADKHRGFADLGSFPGLSTCSLRSLSRGGFFDRLFRRRILVEYFFKRVRSTFCSFVQQLNLWRFKTLKPQKRVQNEKKKQNTS